MSNPNKRLSLKVNDFEKGIGVPTNRKTFVEIEYAIKFDPFEKEFLLSFLIDIPKKSSQNKIIGKMTKRIQ